MVLLVGLFLAVSSSFVNADTHKNCCVFVGNSERKEVRLSKRVSATWFETMDKQVGCDVKTIREVNYESEIPIDFPPISCEKVYVWAKFHGLPEFSRIPFQIANLIAFRTKAHEVCYDGVTCLVFNDTQDVQNYGNQLAACHPETQFTVTGNQNLGVIRIPLFGKPKNIEAPETASKMTVENKDGQQAILYAPCMPAGDACAFWNPNARSRGGGLAAPAKNNINRKYCMHDGQIVEQECCPKKEKALHKKNPTIKAFWSAPAEKCPDFK